MPTDLFNGVRRPHHLPQKCTVYFKYGVTICAVNLLSFCQVKKELMTWLRICLVLTNLANKMKLFFRGNSF